MVRNKDCTSFEIEIAVRKRMNDVANARNMTMKAWLALKVEEDEKELGIVK